MTTTFRLFNFFLSSPNDVQRERNIAEEIIKKVDRVCKEVLEMSLEVKRWENMTPITPNLPEQRIQDIIDIEVNKSTFFVLILNKRYGTIEEGQTVSNTEREINSIIARFEKNKAIKILSYFKKSPNNPDPGGQEQKVLDLKFRLQKLGLFYKEYESEEEFQDLLTHAVYDVVIRMQLSPFKKLALRKVLQLGKVEGSPYPEVAIVYPPVPREYMRPLSDKEFWFSRLQPNIFFEDYKGLYKIHKCLSLIGFHNYKIYPDTDMPDNLDKINRIWICLPRLPKAKQYLDRYSAIARFKFYPRIKDKVGYIEWTTKNGSKIKINSPLGNYLSEQRKTMKYKGEWNSHLGKIIAKDFAILARFKDIRGITPDSDGSLHDYFFTGIRGLGTWGATWYLDRRYNYLIDLEEDANIQILLEVTYANGRISEVKDVSDESEKYFQKQINLKNIRSEIKAFQQREHK